VTRDEVGEWIAAYERAWRTAGTDTLEGLFTEDAQYAMSPYEEPVHGLVAIARLWDAERDAPDEVFTLTSEVLAADGDTAVVRLEVRYGDPVWQEYRDLWVLRFAPDGRCRAFEEWPYWPSVDGAPS